MDPAADRRHRRLLIAAIAGGLALALLIGVGIYGLLRGPVAPTDPAPTGHPSPVSPIGPSPTASGRPAPIRQNTDPEGFARGVAEALFTWDTATGYGPSDYAQVLADVASPVEAEAFAGDVRAYLPTTEAWGKLRQYATRQWLTIDTAIIPAAWETAVAQAAPGQIPDGATAYTITGTRHRDGTWGTTPVEVSRPVSFTVFLACTPPIPGRSASSVLYQVLRLSELDNPLR